MSTEKAFTRKCKRCEQELPIKAFAVRNRIISPLCLNCEAMADDQGGSGGFKLHKDRKSEYAAHGTKSKRDIKTEEYLEEKEDKQALEDEDKLKKVEEKKDRKVSGFLKRLRDTKSLFQKGAEKGAAGAPAKTKDASNFLEASEYLQGQHDSSAQAMDQTGERAKIAKKHWQAHSAAGASAKAQHAVFSQSQQSSSMIGRYSTWERRKFGEKQEESKTAQKGSEKEPELDKDDPVKKVIDSWRPSSGKK